MRKYTATVNLALLMCLASFPGNTLAVTVTAKVSARIIPALSASVVKGMSFGDIETSSAGGQVTLDTYIDSSQNSGGPNAAHPAILVINGNPNATFSILLPKTIEIRDSNGQTMAINQLVVNSGAGTLDNSGYQQVAIGGTLSVSPNQALGDYTGAIKIELNYN